MKYSKTLIFLGIGCVAVLLFVIGVRIQAQNVTKKEIAIAKVNEMKIPVTLRMEQFKNHQQGLNWNAKIRSKSSESDNSSDFYKVIVNNNIFRPLGWRPPNREPQYTLNGTFIDPNGTRVEAFISEERSGEFYVAGVGDKVGDAIVKEIQDEKVTLDKNGETITLRKGNVQFLKSSGSRRSSPSRSASTNRDESNKGDSSKSFDKEAAMRKAKEEAMKKAREMRGKFQNIPPGDREKIMRELKEHGVFKGKGGEVVTVTFD